MTSQESKSLRATLRVIRKLAEEKNETLIARNADEALKFVKNCVQKKS